MQLQYEVMRLPTTTPCRVHCCSINTSLCGRVKTYFGLIILGLVWKSGQSRGQTGGLLAYSMKTGLCGRIKTSFGVKLGLVWRGGQSRGQTAVS